MGLMEHKIKGNEAEQAMAKEMRRPWYEKVESWLTIINIVLLIINTLLSSYIYLETHKQEQSQLTFETPQESKCFSYTTYDQNTKLWRWRAEHLNEYFPTRDDAVANCVVILGGLTN